MLGKILNETEGDQYLKAVRDGSLQQGLGIGCKLDEHLLFKYGTFNVILGQANVGKTDWIVWYQVCLTIKHKLSWLVFSSENSVGSLKRKILNYWTGKNLEDLTEEEFNDANRLMNLYFKFIDTSELYSGNDLLNIFEENRDMFDGAIIDPYNSLTKDLSGTNSHEYDYQMASEIRLFCKRNKKTVYVVAHAVTESLRRVHAKDHTYAGLPIPPNAADIEGGGKWVNRADDFIVLHRYLQHEHNWMITQVNVRKVKETETGGKPTFIDSPVGCYKHYNSFLLENVNPIGEDHQPKELKPDTTFDMVAKGEKKDDFDWLDDKPDEIPF
jgi:hypothetical protein